MARRNAKGFSKTLDATRQQKRNHPANKAAKILIRQKVLGTIGPDNARVFDAFAGRGEMHKAVWYAAAGYVGCDTAWFEDDRLAYVADNRRVMRCIDLGRFNVFDFDAFGGPWEQALILAARRKLAPGERIGIVLTDGSNLDLSMGGMAGPLRQIAGFVDIPAGAARAHGEIINRAISGLCRRLGAAPVHRWDAQGSTGAKVRSIGLVAEAPVGALP